MKIVKTLFINKEPVKYWGDDIRLFYGRPGKAVFHVESEKKITGLVQFVLGYSHTEKYNYFFGYITKSVKENDNAQIIHCLELSSSLKSALILNLENVDLNEILLDISNKTGLQFVTPDQPYSKIKVSQFYNMCSGFHALDSLGEILSIENFIWYQQGDGIIFVGSRDDSYFAKRPLPIDSHLFEDQKGTDSARIAIHPGLRPGMKVNGCLVTSVQLTDVHQVVKCA